MLEKHKKIKSRKSNDNITKRNHYVPRWYQNRFMKEGQTRYWCLDKSKESDNTYYDIPKSFFQQKHLYTIELFGQRSDLIERSLFGDIDVRGFKAIDIIAIKDGWMTKHGHKGWQDFIEFMNAQKLRTLKGLDWIKKELSKLPNFNYVIQNNNIVLNYMQMIRQLYCAMWTEAIWEIVSARNSEVKFIVSDNPVTFYNYRISPESDGNKYPDEPSLEIIGTQTIYPLSLDYCLILTHRQLALEPETANPIQSRINARYYDQAIFSFQEMIYGRELTTEDICVFNYVLKQQARSHISAAKKDWLYPEKYIKSPDWQEFHKLFIPPKDKIRISTGIFIGHRNGSIEGFNPYGQKITDPKELEGIKRSTIIVKKHMRKEKFSKELTEMLNKYDSPTIEEQNKLLMEGIADVFEAKEGENIESLRTDFSADKVKKLYMLIEDLWPAGIDIFKMLRHEDGFNLIYSGEMDFRVLPRKLLNLSLYFDKVYITNPFPHPCCMRDSYNPLIYPEQYLKTTYDLIISIITLEPWISTGQLQILPNPFSLDFSFRKIAMDNVEKRKNQLEFQQDEDFVRSQLVRQFERILFITPDKALEHTIKNLIPNMPKSLIEELAKDIRLRKKNDPVLWVKSLEEVGPQLLVDKICENLETIVYLAYLTNAVPYTYLKFKKIEMESINTHPINPIEHEMKFLNCNDGFFIKALKDTGFLEEVRVVLRKLKNQPCCKELHEELKEEISKAEKDWPAVNKAITTINKKKYKAFNAKMFFNTGQFNLPLIQNHIKSVYGDKSLSTVKMYLSADL